jgi:uncharacterized Fe-S cluster protein YjdI
MADNTKEYSNGDVTIIWQAEKCQHSEKCWRGLPGVFNYKERPWIKPVGGTTEEIVEQVKKCPSGALTYRMTSK